MTQQIKLLPFYIQISVCNICLFFIMMCYTMNDIKKIKPADT